MPATTYATTYIRHHMSPYTCCRHYVVIHTLPLSYVSVHLPALANHPGPRPPLCGGGVIILRHDRQEPHQPPLPAQTPPARQPPRRRQYASWPGYRHCHVRHAARQTIRPRRSTPRHRPHAAGYAHWLHRHQLGCPTRITPHPPPVCRHARPLATPPPATASRRSRNSAAGRRPPVITEGTPSANKEPAAHHTASRSSASLRPLRSDRAGSARLPPGCPFPPAI